MITCDACDKDYTLDQVTHPIWGKRFYRQDWVCDDCASKPPYNAPELAAASPPQSPPTTAIEILNNLGSTLYCLGQDWQKGDIVDVEERCTQALAELESLMMGVIGDDEPVWKAYRNQVIYEMERRYRSNRNELRTQQRTALKAIFKQEV